MEKILRIEDHKQIAQRQGEDIDKVDLLRLGEAIWQRKWSILALVLIVSIVAALAAFAITPIYRATASMLIEQKGKKMLSIEQVYGIEGVGSEYLETQFELLKSRALAERVVRQLNLTSDPEFDPRQKPKPLIDIKGLFKDFLPAAPPLTDTEIFTAVTKKFMEDISIQPQGKSHLVKVQVEMTDPRMAALAANTLANAFIESQLDASMEMAATASNWMNSRVAELRIKLKESEEQLQAFREAENLVDVGGVSSITAAELSLTGERMIDARRQRAEAESQYQQVQAMRSGGWARQASIPAVLSNPLIQQFKADEAKARAKVDELSRRYGAHHPAMEAAQSDLNAASVSLRSQVQQVVAGIERNYQLAVANERSLQASFDVNKSQIQDISRKEFKLRELQREVDANRSLYDTFMTRLKETTATSDMETASARVVDQAVVPSVPIMPNKPLIIGIAALLAGLVGAGLTLLLDALNNTFKTTEQVEASLNIPVLGILPLIKSKARHNLARVFRSDRDEDRNFSESMRTIRTGVMLSGMDHAHKIMLITSSIPFEGKSTVAANLAIALGSMEKVLLIDADMRRPTLAKNFELPVGTPGLANLISGTAKLEDCIRQIEGIDMLSAGSVPPNPLELLSSPQFANVIKLLKGQYERIIIDSPPIQAVSDTLILSTFANSLIYVIKYDSTPVPLVERGVGQLLQSNAPVTGIILNQVDMKIAKKYGYSSYGYHEQLQEEEVVSQKAFWNRRRGT